MAHPRLRRRFDQLLILSLSLFAACSSSGTGNGPSAGSTSAGGAGAGGSDTGETSVGGNSGAGGITGLAGSVATGGAAGPGGSSGFGGGSGRGGTMTSGGSTAAGGSTATGGKSAAGGATGNGGSSGKGGTTGSASDEGFSYRPVQDKQLDWLCTLHKLGPSTYVYVQLDQTGTKSVGIATVPVYTARRAQMSVNGAVTDLADAQYDYGGGHHNDSLAFAYQSKTYSYYHSSFGFGFRQCQPMDCLNIYPQGGTTPETEGCASTRTLPEVCVPIKADGTHAPLVDTFKKCAGDSTP